MTPPQVPDSRAKFIAKKLEQRLRNAPPSKTPPPIKDHSTAPEAGRDCSDCYRGRRFLYIDGDETKNPFKPLSSSSN
jgi:hypothetical protein